jgi:hypothetical protein
MRAIAERYAECWHLIAQCAHAVRRYNTRKFKATVFICFGDSSTLLGNRSRSQQPCHLPRKLAVLDLRDIDMASADETKPISKNTPTGKPKNLFIRVSSCWLMILSPSRRSYRTIL